MKREKALAKLSTSGVAKSSKAKVSYADQIKFAYDLADEIANSVPLAGLQERNIQQHGSVVVLTYQHPAAGRPSELTHYAGRNRDPSEGGVPLALLVEGAAMGKARGTVGGNATVVDILNDLFQSRGVRFIAVRSPIWRIGHQILAIMDEGRHIENVREQKEKGKAPKIARSQPAEQVKPRVLAPKLRPRVKPTALPKAVPEQEQESQVPQRRQRAEPAAASAPAPQFANAVSQRRLRIEALKKKKAAEKKTGQQGGMAAPSSHCSICGSPGVNAGTCPYNPYAINTKPRKHNVRI